MEDSMTWFCIVLFFVMLAPVITGADATQKGATELLARIDHLVGSVANKPATGPQCW
jgi:hypothetical protein